MRTGDEGAYEAHEGIHARVLQEAGSWGGGCDALALAVRNHMLHTYVQEAICEMVTLQSPDAAP